MDGRLDTPHDPYDTRIAEDRPRGIRRRPIRERSSVVVGSIWMVLISIALFFIPLLNGFVAGIVGGYKVGGVGRALMAAVLPAIVVGIALWVIFGVFDAPIIGLFAGVAVAGWVLLSDLGLFLGAAIGGAAGSPAR